MSKGQPINIASYADELIFQAGNSLPWQVSPERFVEIFALLSDSTPIAPADLSVARDFVALAFQYAGVECSDVSQVYKAVCETARAEGRRVYGDPAILV